jgi:competence protein ComFC
VVAKGMVREVIHRYKYQRALWFEPFLADLLVRQAAPQLTPSAWDLIVPVPLHTVKQREREFNQAERLALHLSRATLIPLQKRLIERVRPTRTQTKLGRTDRAGNVRGAFAAKTGVRIEGQRVILVDDVFTTGATTDACAKVLLGMGAETVGVWTVARGV